MVSILSVHVSRRLGTFSKAWWVSPEGWLDVNSCGPIFPIASQLQGGKEGMAVSFLLHQSMRLRRNSAGAPESSALSVSHP